MKKQPRIFVGIMAEPEINFSLFGNYSLNKKSLPVGEYAAKISDKNIVIAIDKQIIISEKEINIKAENKSGSFQLKDVTIGINFHWEQKEDQLFRGSLKFIVENNKIRCINIIALEEYLQSVISSEMSATSSAELLKAHAVISRSWLLAQIEKSKKLSSEKTNYQSTIETENERIKWYDREDHSQFDVCADDHCQRYQGITKIISQDAFQAVDNTFGEVLSSEGEICDARFSKCCGGITEDFENVWEPIRFRCLTKVVDSELGDKTCVDLRQEDEANTWIRNRPHAFCNTTDKEILSQVLPEFDQKTTNFYRWKIEYSQNQLSDLIKKRSGIDFGKIIKLKPVKRGHSGRLIKLKIEGTKKTFVVGKELEIRKWLSESHLYSSAFTIDHEDFVNGIPQKVVFTGAGWGHGVGLCQIGAAVMGEKGYTYKEILKHYFKEAELNKLYSE